MPPGPPCIPADPLFSSRGGARLYDQPARFSDLTSLWCRHFTLPTVCRGWAAVCEAPSALWSDVDADVREYSAHHGCTVNATLLRGWLAKRAAAIKTLNLRWAAPVS